MSRLRRSLISGEEQNASRPVDKQRHAKGQGAL